MDQLVNQAAFLSYMSGGQTSVPLVVRCQGGSMRSSAAQHSKSLEAWFAHVPGIKFVAPTTVNDAYWLLRAAVEDPNPVIFFEENRLYRQKGELDRSRRPVDLYRPCIRLEGADVTLVAWAGGVGTALEVAGELKSLRGISAEVIDLRWVAPLDLSVVLESVEKTNRLVVIQEAWRAFGVGAEIAASVSETMFHRLRMPVMRFGSAHCPHPFSPILEKAMQPTISEIASAIAEGFTAGGAEVT